MFGFGKISSAISPVPTNIVSSSGTVANDVYYANVPTYGNTGAGYGNDKGIFLGGKLASGGGYSSSLMFISKVSNTGVLASNTNWTNPGGTVYSENGTAVTFGLDKILYAFGKTGTFGYPAYGVTFSNTGDPSSAYSVIDVNQNREYAAGATIDNDKGIVGFAGIANASTSVGTTNSTQLISNTGVLASNQTALTGTIRTYLAGTGLNNSGGFAIFGFGYTSLPLNVTNIITNQGIVQNDQSSLIGTARSLLSAASIG
jgi:hypothetical protein